MSVASEVKNLAQQTAKATGDIAQQVNDNIGEVQQTSEETGRAARRALETATDLSGQSTELRNKADEFLGRCRAA